MNYTILFIDHLWRKRMRLRKLEKKDATGMLEWMQDPDIQKKFRFQCKDKTLKEVLQFISSAKIIPLEGQSVHFAVVDDTDEYMGTISLKKIDFHAANAEYAISLRKRAQEKGIAAEATKEILRIAFEDWNLQKVYLNVLSDNYKAIHLYEKCGFIFEGEFRRHLFLRGEYKSLKWYSMLREEYYKKY